MNDDGLENQRLRNEIERLREAKQSEEKSSWVRWFLAIWILPLVGMTIVQGDDLPKTIGPDLPGVGHISIWGIWFLGVPLVTWLIRKFS